MPPQRLETKVEGLEQRVTDLERIPERMEALELQNLQLGTEMRRGFSAVRDEFAAVRQEMRDGDDETRRLMRVLHEEVISRIALSQEARSAGPRRRGRQSKPGGK